MHNNGISFKKHIIKKVKQLCHNMITMFVYVCTLKYMSYLSQFQLWMHMVPWLSCLRNMPSSENLQSDTSNNKHVLWIIYTLYSFKVWILTEFTNLCEKNALHSLWWSWLWQTTTDLFNLEVRTIIFYPDFGHLSRLFLHFHWLYTFLPS